MNCKTLSLRLLNRTSRCVIHRYLRLFKKIFFNYLFLVIKKLVNNLAFHNLTVIRNKLKQGN